MLHRHVIPTWGLAHFGFPSILPRIDLLDVLNDDRRVREVRERLHAVALGKHVRKLAFRFDDMALGAVKRGTVGRASILKKDNAQRLRN